jgi:RimJ/RimL family protein N-acetyltransferase
MTPAGTARYPRMMASEAGDLELRFMTAADEPAVLAFARRLPDHDLLFLPRDIAQPKVVSAWIAESEAGALTTLLATRNGTLVGIATIAREPLSWSAHVGEIRVIVGGDVRGKGIGRLLIEETFRIALDLGLEKLVAQMTVDQRGAIAVFESMGFRGEALLRDHVKDRRGNQHDLVVLSHDVARFESRIEAYGLGQTQ